MLTTITLVRVISTASLYKVTTPVIHQETCAEHRTGENCDTCLEECSVKCIAVEGRYTCSDLGNKVCHANWRGM